LLTTQRSDCMITNIMEFAPNDYIDCSPLTFINGRQIWLHDDDHHNLNIFVNYTKTKMTRTETGISVVWRLQHCDCVCISRVPCTHGICSEWWSQPRGSDETASEHSSYGTDFVSARRPASFAWSTWTTAVQNTGLCHGIRTIKYIKYSSQKHRTGSFAWNAWTTAVQNTGLCHGIRTWST